MDSRIARAMVVAVVLAALAVTSASLQQAPIYEASVRMLMDQGSLAQGTGEGKIRLIPLAPTPETLQGFTQEMIHAIDSRPVAEETLLRLGLQMEPAELLDNLTVEQVEGTSFILLTYQGPDPLKAAKIVNTVGQISSERISPISAVGSKYTATMYEKAAAPESPVSPHPLRNGLLTLVIGLVLCVALLLAPIHRSS